MTQHCVTRTCSDRGWLTGGFKINLTIEDILLQSSVFSFICIFYSCVSNREDLYWQSYCYNSLDIDFNCLERKHYWIVKKFELDITFSAAAGSLTCDFNTKLRMRRWRSEPSCGGAWAELFNQAAGRRSTARYLPGYLPKYI